MLQNNVVAHQIELMPLAGPGVGEENFGCVQRLQSDREIAA
jgi:hypothetical protein